MGFSVLFSGRVKTTALALLGVLSIIVLSSVVVGLFAHGQLKAGVESWDYHHDVVVPKLETLSALREEVGYGGLIHQFKNYVLRHDQKYYDRVNKAYKEAVKSIDHYQSLGSVSEQERQALSQFGAVMKKYRNAADVVQARVKEGATAQEIDQIVKINDAPALQALAQIDEVLHSYAKQNDAELVAAWGSLQSIVRGNAMGGVLVALGLAVFFSLFTRKVLKMLGGEPTELMELASQLRDGQLSQVSSCHSGETENVRAALCRTARQISEVLRQVQISVDTVQSGVSEIADSQVMLAERTLKQADSLEGSTSSLSDMSASVEGTAQLARKAKRIAGDSREQTHTTGTVVAEAVSSMSELADSSKKIADINGVIDEIAFQTNLLALNAAVEAARAGENGRGFAVVATEVRNLAQRSSQAAKEIKELIDESVQRANNSTETVNRAGEAIQGIKASIEEVDNLVSEIADANERQTSGISAINDTVSQLNKVTQDNNALVEENSTATSTIKQETQVLSETIAYFSLDGGTGVRVPRPSAPQARKPSQPMRSTVSPSPSPAAPVKAEKASGWTGEERRSADRPWSGKTTSTQTTSDVTEASPKLASSGGEEWSSF